MITDEAAGSRAWWTTCSTSAAAGGGVEPRQDWIGVDEVIQRGAGERDGAAAGFDLALDPSCRPMNADAAQLERALANVLENAARFAGEETVTDPRAGRRAADPIGSPTTGRGSRRRTSSACSSPSTGPGRDGAGSGLGLAIARGFLEANGGRIRAESLPGQGTSFVIQLPLRGARPDVTDAARARGRRRATDPPGPADHPP